MAEAPFKRGDVVDVYWHPEEPRCAFDWNGLAVVEHCTHMHDPNEGWIISVHLIRSGMRGGFHVKDLTKLGHIEVPDGDVPAR